MWVTEHTRTPLHEPLGANIGRAGLMTQHDHAELDQRLERLQNLLEMTTDYAARAAINSVIRDLADGGRHEQVFARTGDDGPR
jgi:hypothetical protein